VIREHRNLAAELRRLRIESEQTGSEEIRKIASLVAASEEARSASVGQAKQLADLQRRIVELETQGHQSLERVDTIETSLADSLSRLDAVDKELRAFDARSREQEKEFGDARVLAITRQNATDERLEELRDTSRQQVRSIETSLAETSTRLETMGGRIRTQEQKLDLEHQLYLHTVQEIQSQVRSQDHRLNWTIVAAVIAMLLGSVTGWILIRDVQNHARILGGLSREVKRLGSTMAQSRLAADPARAGESSGLPDSSHAGRRNDPKEPPDAGDPPHSGP